MKIFCLKPIIDNGCELLILGTMPSVESLGHGKYYANPKNHFWDFVFRTLNPKWDFLKTVDDSITFNERYNLLLDNKIALWDVLESCEREGSSDKKIQNQKINDFVSFFNQHRNIETVIFNGGNAEKYFIKQYNKCSFENINFHKVNSSSTLNPNNTFKILNEWKYIINNAC